jgi:hypothetical protein
MMAGQIVLLIALQALSLAVVYKIVPVLEKLFAFIGAFIEAIIVPCKHGYRPGVSGTECWRCERDAVEARERERERLLRGAAEGGSTSGTASEWPAERPDDDRWGYPDVPKSTEGFDY